MALAGGGRLGPYEIVSALGAGGMGEVYRARDPRLDREVAIKILPETFAHDPERVARFQREARTLAALNHPNIGGIHGLEEANGVTALVLELVDGPTLADRIAQGPIPVDEAVPLARQIAEALEAAHEQGIVHRDLKPANIKLRTDGTVKVLDFGLAKALEPAVISGDLMASPTITSPAMTQMGIILGTAAYMSPEQAKGRAVDRRSDIWAFGAVLYEMLSGQRAFKGDDISDTLAAVLRQEVDLKALPASTPAAVRRLIARCLERDIRRRLRDIGEARIMLTDPAVAEEAAAGISAQAPPKPLWRRAIPTVLCAVAAGALAAAVTLYLTPKPAPAGVMRFTVMLGEGQVFNPQATGRQLIAISPDGTQMVYQASGRLYLRSMSQLEPRMIASSGAPADFFAVPAFSPDGQWVAFWSSSDQSLRRVALSGGAAVQICRAGMPSGLSWGTEGIVFGQAGRGILRVSANGGTPEVLVPVKEGEEATNPQILPGGETVLFTLGSSIPSLDRWDKATIVAHSLRSGERKTLVEEGSDGRYVPTGHLVYALGGILFAIPMDPRSLELTGGPVPILEGVMRARFTGGTQLAFSASGSLVYLQGPVSTGTSQSELAFITRTGAVERLKLPPGLYEHPRVSPDGRQIAFVTDDGKRATVSIYDLGGSRSMRPLTFGGRNRFPIWSRDGRWIVFQSDREGDLAIFRQRADGSGGAERLTKPEPGASHVPESWSPTQELFLFSVTRAGSVSLWTFALPGRTAAPFSDVQSPQPTNAAFSHDGRWVAYGLPEGAESGIYVQPFPATGARYLLSKGAVSPVWSRDRLEVLSQPRGGLQAVQTITTEGGFSVTPAVLSPRNYINFGMQQQRNYDVMPDGRIVGVVVAEAAGMKGSLPAQLQVVLNWFEELTQRVPAPR